MNLNRLQSIFSANGCQKIYVKKLSPNDNSKNQVYLGGNFEILNIFPLSSIETESAGNWERERFKATIKFSWISEDGQTYLAPHTQFILYPKYPEVRFSGFLLGSQYAPSDLMTQRTANRLLFMSVTNQGSVIGFVASPDSELSREFEALNVGNTLGVFLVIVLPQTINNKERLIEELTRINKKDWIISKRLDRKGNLLPCESPNCGGLTLEAELGIKPNGYSEPDFLGWEIKQFGVKDFKKLNNAVITLMTPEPTHGYYISSGAEAFINKYGYADKNGKPDRKNFGGIHKSGVRHLTTGLELILDGFDKISGKIRNSSGMIALVDKHDSVAASWSFSSLLLHWNRKHNQACYVPSLVNKTGDKKYKFGEQISLGIGTDFQFFLKEMAIGNIYYDPGIKMESASSYPKIKKRSQFRIKSKNLTNLYRINETINLNQK
jgi:MvaI/BcnI restriction endonuclease family